MCSVDLTTHGGNGGSAPAQRINALQQLAQADQAELRITLQLPALARSVGVRPAPRELHRRAIGEPHDKHGLARRQDLERATLQRMVAADDGDLGGTI